MAYANRSQTQWQYSAQVSPAELVYPINERHHNYVNQGNEEMELERDINDAANVQPFSFACQLAHGSNQVRVNGFASFPELYARISERFSIHTSSIMYCTLDTPQVDMTHLLGNQLLFNHTIYVHVRGQTKEVRFIKTEEKLGITVTDNKAGGVFIKALSKGVLSRLARKQENSVAIGDLIECINGRSFVSSRHVDVVKFLRELPLKGEIVLRLISPQQGVIPGISARTKRNGTIGSHTIRITDTSARLATALNKDQMLALKQLADTVDDFIGIADEELAQTIFEVAQKTQNKGEFSILLNAELGSFNFPENIVYKFWWIYENYIEAVKEEKEFHSSENLP